MDAKTRNNKVRTRATNDLITTHRLMFDLLVDAHKRAIRPDHPELPAARLYDKAKNAALAQLRKEEAVEWAERLAWWNKHYGEEVNDGTPQGSTADQ